MHAFAASQAPFGVRPLTPRLGAEISGLDLARGVAPAEFRALYDAFLRYQVLLFPPNELPPAAQVAFARQFGEVQVHVMTMYHADGFPELYVVNDLGSVAPNVLLRNHGGRLERPVGSRRMCLKVEFGRRHLYDPNEYFRSFGVFAP
jgi:alpha-ketoglutarate-dependent taurine dioxygenase